LTAVVTLRAPRLLLAALVAAGLLAACGGDGDEQVAVVSTTTTTEAPPADPDPAEAVRSPGADDADDAGDDGGGPDRPRPPGGCEELAETADGRYVVRDAGEVVIRRDGDALVLEEVRAAEGWRFEGDRKGKKDDEIEVTFRHADRKIEFEAELDDDDLEIEVCEKD
jgi:hypothetical protein